MGRVKSNGKVEKTPTRVQPSRTAKRKATTSEPDVERHEKRVKLNTAAEMFQGLIRERKTEVKVRTMEKIKREKEVIEGMKSDDGEDCLLQIFPKEIWHQILSTIQNPMDLTSLWKVNPLFRDLLADSLIPKILFPQSLHNLLSNKLCHHKSWKHPTSKFRRISKPLRNEVDKWYEDNLLFCLQGGEGHVQSYSVTFCKEESKLDKTLQLFCSGPATLRARRFFLRSFQLTADDWYSSRNSGRTFGEPFTEFKRKLISLLDVIGAQIWHFAFKFSGYDTLASTGVHFAKVCVLIQQFALLMPNLKWLEIQFEFPSPLQNTKSMLAASRSDPDLDEFPLLPNLERIDFRFFGKDLFKKFIILEPILHVNRHVKILKLETITDSELTRRTIQEIRCNSFLPVKLNGLEVLEPLIQMIHGLQSLHFTFDSKLHGNLKTAFNFVNNFPTLETLSMEVQNLSVGGVLPTLNLLNLKNFKITIADQDINYAKPGNVYLFYSLQFLLHSKNLRSIIWDNRTFGPNDKLHRFLVNHEDQGDMINFKGGYWDLNRSNIWDVFPELEKLKVNMRMTKNLLELSDTNGQHNYIFVDKEYRRSEVMQFRRDSVF